MIPRYLSNPSGYTASYVVDIEYMPVAVMGEIDSVVARALGAGAVQPLTYIGTGMTSIVLCDVNGVGWKVARRVTDSLAGMLEDEAEWLATAVEVPWVRDHVARFNAYHPAELVIERECVFGSRGGWSNDRPLHDIHGEIERRMLPHGWTAPEFKEDSYISTKDRGWVLVDASMGRRVGDVLVAYVIDVIEKRRPARDSLEDLAFFVRMEVSNGTVSATVSDTIERRISQVRS